MDEKILWLTAVFSVTQEDYIRNFNDTDTIYSFFTSGKTVDIKKAVEFLSQRFGFVAPSVQYDWSGEISDFDSVRGIMTEGRIILSILNTYNKYALAAVTVHELMHYALINRKNIIFPDRAENEKITDLAAIVIGFGNLILNGKAVKREEMGGVSETLGILTTKEAIYGYNKVCRLRGINNVEFLTPEVKSQVQSYKVTANIETKKEKRSNLWKIIQGYCAVLYRIFWPFVKDRKQPRKFKKCPFCKKSIVFDSEICTFCNRLLIERV